MKKRIALILFAAMLVSMLAGCGGDSSTDSTDDSAGTTETSGADPSDSSIQGKFLYIITDNLGDMGFRDNGLRGVQNVCETYGCEYDVIELGGDKSTYENAFADACDSGEYAYIITCSNGGMSDLVLKYGPEYPEIKFVTFDVGATIATVVNTHISSPVPMAACQIWCSSMVRNIPRLNLSPLM